MSKMLVFLLRFYFLWIFLFFVERLIFIAYFYSKVFPLSIQEFGSIFLFGLRLDASMAGYICAIPLLFFILNWFISSIKLPAFFSKGYFFGVWICCALITVVNLNIYQEWGTKLPFRALSTFIEYPYESFISSLSSPILIPFILFSILVFLGWLLISKLMRYPMVFPSIKNYQKIPISIFLMGMLFLLIRSGWQTAPLNPSMAYFSTKPILNHAAVNTEWNLMSDLLHNESSNKNPFQYLDDLSAQKEIAPYLNATSSSPSILNQERPNVVLIILESFTSDLIESLGGEAGIAPKFEKLVEKGLLFTNIYASSDRTDKGMIAIMSAFPSQATQSIIKNVNKLESLPAIGQDFLENGYKTSFFIGGESEFYNLKSYMLGQGVQDLIDRHDFRSQDVRSKWGAFDHLTFQKQLQYLDKSSEPFFSTLLTLTNHEPFEVPGKHKFGTNNQANLFKSTAFYTDSVLFDYFEKAEKSDWYSNTLFVIIADHGHRLPLEKWESHHPERYRIPFLLYGDVLKVELQGKKMTKIGNQTDLASTLLHQLEMDSKSYYWSKDLLDPKTPSFGFFTWNNGFGVVSPEQSLSFDNVGQRIIYLKDPAATDSINQNLQSVGQAYLQEVYRQYLSY